MFIMEVLNLSKRMKIICYGIRKERRNGKILGIIYGKEIGNEMFEVDLLEL